MPSWLESLLIKLVLDGIKSGGIHKVAEKIEHWIVPYLRFQKQAFIAKVQKAAVPVLGAELAAETAEALSILLDAFMPDCPTCLADVPKYAKTDAQG